MKKYIYALLITAFVFSILNTTNAQTNHGPIKEKTIKNPETGYVILSNERFKEIFSAMEKQESWSPILLEGFSKEEKVAFYIQSYDDEWIEKYMYWAYQKIHKSEKTKPDSHQERKLQKSLLGDRTRQSSFLFLMLLSEVQIELLGY